MWVVSMHCKYYTDKMRTPVFCPYIRRKDMDSVLNCLVTDSIGPGEYVEKFLKIAKEVIGFEYGLAMRSMWSGLSLALDMLGLQEGSTIAVPVLAPAFYLDVLKTKKLVPAFLDHNPRTGIVEFDSIEKLDTKPSAIILYESLGIMPEPESIENLGIPIIEDISTTLGATSNGINAGSLGRISLLGLEQDGLITTGGGVLVFSCFKRDAQVLKHAAESIMPEIMMTDYNAALGYAQCRDLIDSIKKRKELFASFVQSLAKSKHAAFIQPGVGDQGYWAFPVSLTSGMKEIRIYAKKKEVDTEAAFDTSILATAGFPENICPGARSLSMRTVLFPLHQRIDSPDAAKISKVLSTLP